MRRNCPPNKNVERALQLLGLIVGILM